MSAQVIVVTHLAQVAAFADHHVVKESRTEVHERTEFRDLETGAKDVLVKTRRVPSGEEVAYRAKYVIAADGPRSAPAHENATNTAHARTRTVVVMHPPSSCAD